MIVLGLSALLMLAAALALGACGDSATTNPDATSTAGVAAAASAGSPEAGPTRGARVYALDMDPRDPSVLYAATSEGLFSSNDGAESWSRLPGTSKGHYLTVAVDPIAPSTIYAIHFKDDTGGTYPDFDSVGRTNAAAGFAASNWGGVDAARFGLQRSDDGGATWVELSDAGSPRVSVWEPFVWFDVTATPSTVFMWGLRGADLRVYRSSDRGETWTRDRTAERQKPPRGPCDVRRPMPAAARKALDAFMTPETSVGAAAHIQVREGGTRGLFVSGGVPLVDPRDPSVFYAGTQRGAYKSLDGGKTWKQANVGLGAATPALPATPPLPGPSVAGTLVFAKVVDAGILNYDIFLVRSDGTGLTRLTDGPVVEEHPSWSPDGQRIVYEVSDGNDDTCRLWVMNADGSGKVALPGVIAAAPHWSPDGARIVYSRDDGVYVMNADGSGQRCVVGQGWPIPAPADTPSWGPNGTIVFVRDGDLYSVKLDGSGLVRLTRNAGLRQCLVSPDGKSVAAYVVREDRLVVMPLHGDGPTVTLLHPALRYIPDGGHPTATWTADGRALVLGSSNWGEMLGSNLYVVNADGSGLSQVPNVQNALSAAWRPE
jgi:Tol biopolymer transport system component